MDITVTLDVDVVDDRSKAFAVEIPPAGSDGLSAIDSDDVRGAGVRVENPPDDGDDAAGDDAGTGVNTTAPESSDVVVLAVPTSAALAFDACWSKSSATVTLLPSAVDRSGFVVARLPSLAVSSGQTGRTSGVADSSVRNGCC